MLHRSLKLLLALGACVAWHSGFLVSSFIASRSLAARRMALSHLPNQEACSLPTCAHLSFCVLPSRISNRIASSDFGNTNASSLGHGTVSIFGFEGDGHCALPTEEFPLATRLLGPGAVPLMLHRTN